MSKLLESLKHLTKRCTYLAHKGVLVEETEELKDNGVKFVTRTFVCKYCGHKYIERPIVIDPNYQINFHEI